MLKTASVTPQLAGITPAIEVKRVIKVKLPPQGFVIVITLGSGEPLEPFGDGFEAPGLRGKIPLVRVSAAHDF
jgi:hypothetical protein